MPNHVVNEVIFSEITEDQRADILAHIVNAEGKIDFSILLPIPLNAWMGSVSVEHEKAFRLTALDWCRENWGTKWNAYSQKPVEIETARLRLVFETAWRPPYGWLAALLNKCGLPFDHNSHDEGRSIGRVGRFSPNGGVFGDLNWSEVDAEGEMQRHLHTLQWGVPEFPADDDDAREATHAAR